MMKKHDPKRIIVGYGDVSVATQLEAQLLKTLRREQPQAENEACIFVAKDEQEVMVGGLTASTSYGWLLIKIVWVADDQRGSGLGRALVQRAEDWGRDVGCHAVWLDTSSPGAKRFYEKLGFATFGELKNQPGQHPEGHCRWFMQKTLSTRGSGNETGKILS